MAPHPGARKPCLAGQGFQLPRQKAGFHRYRPVVQGDFVPAEQRPGGGQKNAGEGVAHQIDGNHRPAGKTPHPGQQSDHLVIRKVVQEQARVNQIETRRGERHGKCIGGQFGSGCRFQVAEAAIKRDDGRAGECAAQRLAHVPGSSADVQGGECLVAREPLAGQREQNPAPAKKAVDAPQVAEIAPRLLVAGVRQKLAADHAAGGECHTSYVKMRRMEVVTGNTGWIEVICGPMFSGKSEELIRRLRRAIIARKRVQVFKPAIDTRYAPDEIVSHGEQRLKAEVIAGAGEILSRLDWRTQVVGVDESNFFGMELVEVANQLADSGKQVIIAGLDTDYMGRPFHPMPELLSLAEAITKALAICVRCGNPAKHTQRLVESDELIVVGAAGMYEARCRRCFEPGVPRQEYFEFARPALRAKT